MSSRYSTSRRSPAPTLRKSLAHAPQADNRRLWVFRAIILASIGLAYFNAVPAALVFDDLGHVDQPGMTAIWPPDWLGGSRSVLRFSLAVNYVLAEKDSQGRSDPRGYHLLNIAIHLGVALALFGLVRRTLRLAKAGGWPNEQADALALATVLVWSVHPLTTQAVTYVVQRCESLAAGGIVLYLYCLLRSAQGGTTAARRGWRAASLAACLLSLASKETGASAIPIGLLFDRVLLASSWRELLARRGVVHASVFVLAAAGVYHLLPELLRPSSIKTAGFNIGTHTWWEYVRSQPGAILHYLRLALWPDRLCLDYFWPAASNYQAILPGLVIVAALLASLWLLWKQSAWSVPAVSFWLLLAPSSGAVAIQDIVFEHRFYAPLMLVVLALVIGLWQCLHWLAPRLGWPARRPRAVFATSVFLVAAALAMRTHRRNDDYRSQLALYEADLNVAPESPRMHLNIALLYWKQEQLELGLRHYREALRTSKGGIAEAAYAYEANWFSGIISRDLGRLEDAVIHLRLALAAARAPEEKMAVGLELATGLEALGRLEEAESVYSQLLELKRQHAKLHWMYAEFLERRGRHAAAIKHWREAAAQAPDDKTLMRQVQERVGS